MRLKATDLFLAILALLLVGVSFWQTWIGLSQIFGGASFFIALVLSLLLLFLAVLVRNAKLNGAPVGGLSAMYIFIALFCFTANFNALYTRFMKTEIYIKEIRDINDKYNQLETDVQSRLSYIVDAQSRQSIVGDVKQLAGQIVDPGNPGIGTRAKIIINRIEKKLGKTLTIYTPTRNSREGYEDLARRMVNQIIDLLEVLSPQEKKLRDDVQAAVLKWNKKTQKMLGQQPEDINTYAVGFIDDATLEYNKLGTQANTTLGDSKFTFEPIKSQAQDVGKIGYAFKHALQNFGVYQMVVLAGCLLLDFLLLILVLLVTNTNQQTYSSNPTENRKKGATLIH